MVARSSPNWPPFLWHDRVHRYKRGERLCYWRATFHPTYERDMVAAGIDAACERHGIKGVVAYELFGAYDLLIRLWLPAECSSDEFDVTLTAELAPAGLSLCESFTVSYMVSHWPFVDEQGRNNVPEERAIHQLSEDEIQEVEAAYPDVRPELLRKLCERHLLYPHAHGSDGGDWPGIKFAITVSADPDLSAGAVSDLEEDVVDILRDATSIDHRSLYAGSGFGRFLILGRVRYESFHAVHTELIAQINAAAIRERHSVRTITSVSGQRGYMLAREGLSSIDAGGPPKDVLPRRGHPAGIVDPDRVLQPGYVFGERFEIREHLGGGGFANVYRAFDRFERIERALKIFKSAQRELALREIAALRKVNHPNVVKVFWGDHDGPRWYIVCEFIEGVSLNRCVHGGDIWALEIVIQVLRALEAVHPDDLRIAQLEALAGQDTISPEQFRELLALRATGLVHRDVKPENIMVGEDGRATLVDFNIASPALQPGDTRSGTPQYQAPDAGLIRWEPSDDLFAIGVVLYELLTGRHPYLDARPAGGLEPIDPQGLRPDLRPSLAKVLVRACASLRADRHRTARELRAELELELGALRAIERGPDTQADRIARLLQARRTHQRMGIATLSGYSGVPPERIEQIERGATRALADALRIAHTLAVNLGDADHSEFWAPPEASGNGRRNGNTPPEDEEDEPDDEPEE